MYSFTVTFKCGTLNHAFEQQVMSIFVYAAQAKILCQYNDLSRNINLLPDVSVNVDVQAKYSLHCSFAVECKPPISEGSTLNHCLLL